MKIKLPHFIILLVFNFISYHTLSQINQSINSSSSTELFNRNANDDNDSDGVINALDQDDDNDGILDINEGAVCFTTPRLITNSIVNASASGAGSTGVPSVSYEAPSGTNRILLVYITVERDHTIAPYGDNWESNWPLTNNASDRQTINFGTETMTLERLRFTYNFFNDPLNPLPNIPDNAEHSSTSYLYSLSENNIPSGVNTFNFSEFILPKNPGDEFSVMVVTYEGVNAIEFVEVDSFFESNLSSWSISGDMLSPNQNIDTTQDQNLLLAYGAVGTENGISSSSAWTNVSSFSVSNNNGTYISDLNPSGGEPATEDDGISLGLYALTGVSGTQTMTFTTSFTSNVVFNQHAMLHRLTGFPVTDTDNDGIANCLDIDTDNDGIPDNIEAQPSNGYIPPSLSIDVNTGIDNAYSPSGFSPEDTDNDGIPDFIDSNSDNDSLLDIEENGDVNTLSSNDTDQDGLNDNFDSNNSTYDVNDEITNGSITELANVFGDVDTDLPNGGDLDYRDTFDINPPASASIDFDGVDDYLDTPSFMAGWQEVTLMAWVKLANDFSTTGDIMGENQFRISITNSQTASFYLILDGSLDAYILNSQTTLPLNEWHHIAITYNGANGESSLYVDGILEQNVFFPSGVLSTNPSLTNPNFAIGRFSRFENSYFKGAIDEARVFNSALTADQIQRMVYQEIENNSSFIKGSLINKDIIDINTNTKIPWNNLQAYWPMTDILTSKTSDVSQYNRDATLYNITTIQSQTAPMPYQTTQDGAWNQESTWLHGNVWDIEEELTNKDWSIVDIKHNVNTSENHTNLGLTIDSGVTLKVDDTNLINNTWYLELDGTIDLQDDSQLIQGVNSDLVTSANGKILRRQEGNTNIYWYNYWASPIGTQAATSLTNNNGSSNNTNNTNFSLDMLKDSNGNSFSFTSLFDNPGMISNAWLYTYQNGLTFGDWQVIDETTNIAPGIGYTQKGTGNSGSQQQYIFEGKPNNGTVLINADDVDADTLNESEQNVTLTTSFIGNPYPSAIDAREFIMDNNGVIGGTIYLWEQWAGNSHLLENYQGGYGTINNVTTELAYQWNDPTQTGSSAARRPAFFIPVAQGFFVEVVEDGDIQFNNSQRVFALEADYDPNDPDSGSVFFRNGNTNSSENNGRDTSDNQIAMIRLQLTVSNGNKRSFVLAFSDITTDSYDYGYDARTIDPADDDLNSFIGDDKMLIQSFSPITDDKVVDLVFNSSGIYNYTLEITETRNIPDEQLIFIKDNLTNTYVNLREGNYSFSSDVSIEDTQRFDIVFQENQNLNSDSFNDNNILIYVNNNLKALFIKQFNQTVNSITLTNMLGQNIKTFNQVTPNTMQNGIDISRLASGVYIVTITSQNNQQISKKIIIN